MSTFPGSPKLLKGGLVLIDPDSGAVRRIIPFAYNPDTVTRTLSVKGVTGESGDRSEALRLTGPPVEKFTCDLELDATDQLEFPEQNRLAATTGIHAQLAALETIVYPESARLQSNNRLAQGGNLEIVPMEAPLTLFIWSKSRVVPVRVTELSIIEEAFDPALNPIRAKVSLGMHVLSVNDLEWGHRGAGLFMAYHQQKEAFAARAQSGTLNALGTPRIA